MTIQFSSDQNICNFKFIFLFESPIFKFFFKNEQLLRFHQTYENFETPSSSNQNIPPVSPDGSPMKFATIQGNWPVTEWQDATSNRSQRNNEPTRMPRGSRLRLPSSR